MTDVVDIAIGSDRDVYLDDANDVALVSGKQALQQSISIHATDAIREFVSSGIDATSLALLEERLRNALNEDPQVGEVWSVTVNEFDKRNDTLKMEVALSENENFELEVSA